ncbi:MAG TPA: UDP-N-acetylmuramate:L-alanyl-gamma-D-glutamyl-meso-diaminopimelate ligase [Gammaproteobacteria bacterium]|nr:UDP-N-acetylmuramate:L-alanyl-gamma-D-glutamyl-meso-diaminopimelate ligase [Gammaproteobacteria bacterium]
MNHIIQPPKTVHILGICGTFMGGIAALAQAQGFRVRGSDANVYPPMSTQLEALGIELMDGYAAANLNPRPDEVVIGNAGIARGNPELEAVLDGGFDYLSGAEWLARNILRDRWVLAVAGTHGKTTTASMLAWILEYAGLEPGFLIGGVPGNFGISARLGGIQSTGETRPSSGAARHLLPGGEGKSFGPAAPFVIEADEYDTSYFDRRSKFVHYRPKTLILNNLEYDHADIFPDLAAIEKQFHQLIRTVPGTGLIVANAGDANIADTLVKGCWTRVEPFAAERDGWQAAEAAADGSAFTVMFDGAALGRVEWKLIGRHNVANVLAAIAAARHAGVAPATAAAALSAFEGVKRRLEVRGEVGGVTVYDDFAHHPTAIATTLDGLRQRVGDARILAVIEPASATMRAGIHRDTLAPALAAADAVYCYRSPTLKWDPAAAMAGQATVVDSIDALVAAVAAEAQPGDHVLVMSNGGFGGYHEKLLEALQHPSP